MQPRIVHLIRVAEASPRLALVSAIGMGRYTSISSFNTRSTLDVARLITHYPNAVNPETRQVRCRLHRALSAKVLGT